MNNVILFESVDNTYYGVYNLETQELYDCEVKTIGDIGDILYGHIHTPYGTEHIKICA